MCSRTLERARMHARTNTHAMIVNCQQQPDVWFSVTSNMLLAVTLTAS